MNRDLGLKVLGQIMGWSDEIAREEFGWLRLMARLKYDGYRDFQAGMRFVESLATWLQQFESTERAAAYSFVKEAIIYVGPGEIRRLVEQFYPRIVRARLMRAVAFERAVPVYKLLSDADALEEIRKLRRKTLFMGLSPNQTNFLRTRGVI